MAQNIKYCDPGLATGINDGSDKDNAWQSLAAANTNAVANDRVYVRSNVGGTAYELTGNPGFLLDVAGTIGEPRTFIAFDWDTDTEVTQANWHGYGGTIGVLINYNNATANNSAVRISAAGNEVVGFAATRTGTVMAYGFIQSVAGAGTMFRLCKAVDSTISAFWSNQPTGIFGCIADTGVTGFTATYGTRGCVAIDCATQGYFEPARASKGGLAIGCAIGVTQAGANESYGSQGMVIYNCPIGIRVNSSQLLMLKNLILEGNTTAIDVQTTAKKLYLQNVSHYNNTDLYGGTGLATSFIEEEGVYESTVSLFNNIAGGDYSNNPNAAVLKQYQNRLLENTYDWTEPGVGQHTYNNVSPESISVNGLFVGNPFSNGKFISITPPQAKAGDNVTIVLEGAKETGNTVHVNGTLATIVSEGWNIGTGKYEIVFTVPAVANGQYDITVNKAV